LRRFAESPDESVLAASATDDQNLHPYRCSRCMGNLACSFEASIVVDEVKPLPYFSATNIDSASDWLSSEGSFELPMRT
jgi:hypothetical protein